MIRMQLRHPISIGGHWVSTLHKHELIKNKMKRFIIKEAITTLILLLGLTESYAQQYTLQDNDVTIIDGIITDCTYDFAIKNIEIPEILDNLEVIGIADGNYESGIFYNKGIERLILPNTLITIGDYAFENNIFLDSINLPQSLKKIGRSAFDHSGLRKIIFPNSLEKIGINAFAHSFHLNEISLPNNPLFKILEGGVFFDCDLSNVVIPNTVTIIEHGALDANDRLDSILLPTPAIPNNLGWIDSRGNKFSSNSYVDRLNTFYYLITPYTLTRDDVHIDENGHIRSCNLDDAFLKGKLLTIPESIDGQTILGIGDYWDDLNSAVFHNKGLSGVILPLNLEHIGRFAFHSNLLNTLSIPANVKYIDDGAFNYNFINDLSFDSENVLVNIGQKAFFNNELQSITLPKSLEYLGDGAFTQNNIEIKNGKPFAGLFYARYPNTTIIDSSTVVSFGSRAAQNLYFIPKSVKHISPYSFSGTRIDSLVLPEGIESVGYGAFRGVLTDTVVLPNSIQYIGSFAFGDVLSSANGSIRDIDWNDFSFKRLDSLLLPQAIKEGYQFTNWQNNKDSIVYHIKDFSSSYRANFSESGFKVSGSFSIPIHNLTFHITGDFEDYVYHSYLREYSLRFNEARSVKIKPNAYGYNFTPEYYLIENINSDINQLDFSVTPLNMVESKITTTPLCYPNPTSDFITIETTLSNIKTVHLYDIHGRHQAAEFENNETSLRLNLSHLPTGIYLINCEDVNGKINMVRVVRK